MKSKSVKNSLTLMCLMTVLVSVIVIGGISISNISTMTSTANKNYENARLDVYNTEIKSQYSLSSLFYRQNTTNPKTVI